MVVSVSVSTKQRFVPSSPFSLVAGTLVQGNVAPPETSKITLKKVSTSADIGIQSLTLPLIPSDSSTEVSDESIQVDQVDEVVNHTSSVIGPAGGEIKVGGCELIIPEGALQSGVMIKLQSVYRRNHRKGLITPVLKCEPHGLKFLKAVVIRLPTCYVTDESANVEVRRSEDGCKWKVIKQFLHTNEKYFKFHINGFSWWSVWFANLDLWWNSQIRKSLTYWVPANDGARFTKMLRCYLDDDVPGVKRKPSNCEVEWETVFHIKKDEENVELRLSVEDDNKDPKITPSSRRLNVYQKCHIEASFLLCWDENVVLNANEAFRAMKISCSTTTEEVEQLFHYFLPLADAPSCSQKNCQSVGRAAQVLRSESSEPGSHLRSTSSHSNYDFEFDYEIHSRPRASEVFHCTRKIDGIKFAAKRVSNSQNKAVLNEMEILSSIDPDRNVVKYIDLIEGTDTTTIVMELCGGNVDQFIQYKKYKRELNDEKYKAIRPIDQHTRTFVDLDFLQDFDISITEIMRQAVKGVKYLHSYQPAIVHGDIKPPNFLLYKHTVHGTIVKIADFGLSQTEESEIIAAGTPAFIAPEYCVDHDEKPLTTREADIFSLGLTLFYIFTEGSHVYGDHPYERLSKIWRREKPAFNEALPRNQERNHVMEGVTDEHRITTCDMIRRMLKLKPMERFNIHDVAKHPTFWNSKKKSDFCQAVHNTLRENENEEVARMRLDWYDANLLDDDQSGEAKISVNLESIPKMESMKWKPRPKFDASQTVTELLRIIRKKSSHGDLTREERERPGLGKDDWNKFLEHCTGDVPQLLVHLYEKFRGKQMWAGQEYYHSLWCDVGS